MVLMVSTDVRTEGEDRLGEIEDFNAEYGCERLGDLLDQRIGGNAGWLAAGKEMRAKVARSGMAHIRGCGWCKTEWGLRDERESERAEGEEHNRGWSDGYHGRERDTDGGDRYNLGWSEGRAHAEWKEREAARERESVPVRDIGF